MKIRQGFVSNSSSTSFVIGGFNVKAKDISIEDIKGDKQYIVLGREWANADDVFFISDSNMLYFLKTAEKIVNMNPDMKDDECHELNFSIYQVLTNVEGDSYETKVDLSKLPNNGIMSIVSLEQDYTYSKNVSDLFDRYFNQDDEVLRIFNTVYTRYQRKDKLNKIEKNV